jgi:hypothetical protein
MNEQPYFHVTHDARDVQEAEKLGISRYLLAGNDTVVCCSKCGRKEALTFENGLKNGWSKCCGGLTMPIIYIRGKTTVENALSQVMTGIPILCSIRRSSWYTPKN